MQEFLTPLMKQYMGLKRQYPDCLLFFRLGDFYELFMEDATIGAQVLDITLTSRPEGKDGRVPMAGVPYHAVDSYLAKLVKAGYKVAICEQLTEPGKKGIVERDVVRVVTPGTLIDEKALERKENNYIISIAFDELSISLSFADLSTGDFQTLQTNYSHMSQVLNNELSRLHPSECILSPEDYENSDLLKILKSERGLNIYPFNQWKIYTDNADAFLKKHFGLKTLGCFGIENKQLSLQSAAALIGYLKETQKDKISHIKKIATSCSDHFVSLDKSTMLNLELFSTIREHDTKGSLLSVLDATQTAMGGRMLKVWLSKPLTSSEAITDRYDVVESLLKNNSIHQNILEHLKEIPDIERVLSRLSIGVGNARDLVNLKNALTTTLSVKGLLPKLNTPLINELDKQISTKILTIIREIDQTIILEPPVSTKDGGFVKSGVNLKLDSLREKIGGSKQWLVSLESQERERTGINTLKVRFNKVFGFYIEVSKSYANAVPQHYMRKQTLVNGERFITAELKEKEEIILTAEATIDDLEYEIFQKLLHQVLEYIEEIQQASFAIATLDCLSNFAYISQKKRYVRPKLIFSEEIKIKNGRHPVVEELLEDTQFVPNDLVLNNKKQQLLIITGPNMAGKSVYIRQVAIIVLMAQIGCFVPADSAHISLVDKIFVRSGASDVITSGLSTFMVEMMETAHILNHATQNSLIVMDEIGRGTSTYDGISIAWATAEYITQNLKTKTLFATHYHELQDLEKEYPNKIKNYHMAVDNSKGDPVFLHTIMPGAASHSFGVAVAKLSGIPSPVIDKALGLLHSLESRVESSNPSRNLECHSGNSDVTSEDFRISKELKSLDINKLTPLEALTILAKLKEQI